MRQSKEYMRAWYQKNKDRIKEKHKTLYWDPTSEFIERHAIAQKKWRNKNLEKCRKYEREYKRARLIAKKQRLQPGSVVEIKIQTEKPSMVRRLLTLFGL